MKDSSDLSDMENIENDDDGFAVETRDLFKVFTMGNEKVNALNGVSFGIRRGDYMTITGPSRQRSSWIS